MTTIVAIKRDKEFCIASDSRYSQDNVTISCNSQKIIACGRSYVGFCGLVASKQHVLANLEQQNQEFQNSQEVFNFFNALNIQSLDKTFQAIIANPYGIFTLVNGGVLQTEPFWAIGSGARFALGALDTMYSTILSLSEIAERAIQTAAKFDQRTDKKAEIFLFSLT